MNITRQTEDYAKLNVIELLYKSYNVSNKVQQEKIIDFLNENYSCRGIAPLDVMYFSYVKRSERNIKNLIVERFYYNKKNNKIKCVFFLDNEESPFEMPVRDFLIFAKTMIEIFNEELDKE